MSVTPEDLPQNQSGNGAAVEYTDTELDILRYLESNQNTALTGNEIRSQAASDIGKNVLYGLIKKMRQDGAFVGRLAVSGQTRARRYTLYEDDDTERRAANLEVQSKVVRKPSQTRGPKAGQKPVWRPANISGSSKPVRLAPQPSNLSTVSRSWRAPRSIDSTNQKAAIELESFTPSTPDAPSAKNNRQKRRSHEWEAYAVCRDEDPEMFFVPDGVRGPTRKAHIEAAKTICAKCPVVGECLEGALDTSLGYADIYSVRGNLSGEERQHLLNRESKAI